MTDPALMAALRELETALHEETQAPLDEARAARKERAVLALQNCLQAPLELADDDAREVGLRLQGLLAANSFSLKWNKLRVQLSQFGKPKPQPPATSHRLDLVH